MNRRPSFVLALLLLLVACATPTTDSPSASPQEIEVERAAQARAAQDNPFPPIVEPVRRTVAMKVRLQDVALRVNPPATKICYEMFGMKESQPCNFSLEIKGERGVNAYTDGRTVYITAPMMLFASDDNHLAFVLAHELAHAIMDHVRVQGQNVTAGALMGAAIDILAASQGVDTGGGFMQTGANVVLTTYSPEFEQEADYIGLYILARAGYPIEKAPDFWRKMAQFEPQGIYVRGTHPSYPERYIAMQKTILEIRHKQAQGLPLMPNIKVKKS
ncbi:MAG: M48 family metallopeptidase [Rickettsiales bacterium]|nr:M48 family metallopeptidase [Rickettsiales bacterium]